ncbi:FAD-dependent monooxygenase [Rhodoligotrophos defluvii]|uniref:FAD-dependent monooxygenase n=1 Tax=Rhodoligotrophos defluvii TaxID=2561934 RepID=UPI0010C9B7FF|nr:FAD-dependent monooxygenase [Rhodoligotrophos defluvii]
MERSQPVIVGGGIAGLAAALALARAGCPSRVLEQAASFEEIGAGLQLGPNGMRALDALGLTEIITPKLVAPRAIEIRDGLTGRLLTAVPLGDAVLQRFGAPYRVVHRADLLGALLAAARQEPLISLETGSPVAAIAPEQGSARVTLRNGSTLTAPAVIGADGVRSAVRVALIGDGDPVYANHTLYRALILRRKAPPVATDDLVTLWLCPGGHVVHYPVSGGERVNIVAAFDSHWHEPGWAAHGSKRALLTAFGAVVPELRAVLDGTDRWLKWAAVDRLPAQRWGVGAVTLIGDAAHPVLPYLAQGASMALEDAVVLGRKLAAGRDFASAFRAYEAERQPRTARMQSQCRQVGRAYHARGPVRLVRNAMLRLMRPAQSYARMAWIYDWA